MELADKTPSIHTLDITGGAPELNPGFRLAVEEGFKRGLTVIDRCNLTVLLEPGQEDLADFLAVHKVKVVASLPCYTEQNVKSQRGTGVFMRSIEGLRLLNEVGYGRSDSGLELDLVYNPVGAFLPPAQESLEQDYKEKLKVDWGIEFTNLLTITNMPIKRFADYIHRRGELANYMELLVQSFNPATVNGLMCRNTVSIGWDGKVYDCDFNQQLAMQTGSILEPLEGAVSGGLSSGTGLTVSDIDSFDALLSHEIVKDHHCFGCTAGSGSSCGGSVV
jgi:radical SAM/Cys-rich protein